MPFIHRTSLSIVYCCPPPSTSALSSLPNVLFWALCSRALFVLSFTLRLSLRLARSKSSQATFGAPSWDADGLVVVQSTVFSCLPCVIQIVHTQLSASRFCCFQCFVSSSLKLSGATVTVDALQCFSGTSVVTAREICPVLGLCMSRRSFYSLALKPPVSMVPQVFRFGWLLRLLSFVVTFRLIGINRLYK